MIDSVDDRLIDVILHGDCMDVMGSIPDKSVDMILCDLPYGSTQSPWDSRLDLAELWKHYKRIAKDNAAILLFCSQPFTTILGASNLPMLRYSLVWNKRKAANFMQGNNQFMKVHEDILVFYRHQPTYNPQKIAQEKMSKRHLSPFTQPLEHRVESGISQFKTGPNYEPNKLLPTSILEFSKDNYQGNTHHPTQKPIKLCEYLIETYTNRGNLVLDNCVGGGTTALAAINTNRHFIGIEKDPEYCEKAQSRVHHALYERLF